MKPIIETRSLTYRYENGAQTEELIPAVSDVSLTIHEGEYVAVLGHNGSGKSTLAKLMNAVLQPTSGDVIVDGVSIGGRDTPEDDIFRAREKVGMVFQNADNQLVATIVEEDVAFGPENLGLPPKEIRRRVDEALKTVGMSRYARHSPHMLSGGQKQRIAIAGVLAMHPRCMIFDESTAMLDPEGRQEVGEVMARLNREEGITILTITHDMEEASRASRVIVMNDGKIWMDGTPAEVFAREEELAAIGLDVPQAVSLVHALRRRGYELAGDIFDEESACRAILQAARISK